MSKEVIIYLKSLSYAKRLPSDFKIKRVYPFIRAVGATCDDGFETEKLPYVEHIACGGRVFALRQNARLGANSRPVLPKIGRGGRGVGICIMDTGVQPHPDFVMPRNRIIAFKDIDGNLSDVYDDNGHGTFVAGVAAGGGVASGGEFSGVAHSASIIALKVIGASGQCGLFGVLDGMQWIADNHRKYGIKVVCMSFGATRVDYADPLERGAEVLVKNGITVVASAGNSGEDGVKSPGSSKKVLTVGSVDDDNRVATFSSYGEIGGSFKPEIYAPGVGVSGVGRGKELYVKMSGTSVSAPFVAGAAALVYERYPSAEPWQVKFLLTKLADDFGGVKVLNLEKLR